MMRKSLPVMVALLILALGIIAVNQGTGEGAVEVTCSDRSELVAALNGTNQELIIMLSGNISAEEWEEELVIPAGKTVTLNLNNHTVSTGPKHVGNPIPLIRVQEGATLYLKGPGALSELEISTTTGGLIDNSGTVTIDGVDLQNIYSFIYNHGTMTLEDFTVSGTGFDNSGENAVLTMNDGTITGLQNSYFAIGNSEGAEFIMNGGSITDNNGAAIYNMSGSVTMNGGTISGNTGRADSSASCGGVQCMNDATFTMTGGTITGNTGRYSGGVSMNRGVFTMTGGSIVGNIATDSTIAGGVISYGVYQISGNVQISGNKQRDTAGNETEANVLLTRNPIIITGPLAQSSRIGYGMSSYSLSSPQRVTQGLATEDNDGNAYGTATNFVQDKVVEDVDTFNIGGDLYLSREVCVTLDAGDGSGRTTQVIAPQNIAWNLPECPFTAPNIPGTVFVGWSVINTEDIVEAGGTMTIDRFAITLQARWQSSWGAARNRIMNSEEEEISVTLDQDLIAGNWDKEIDILNGKKVTVDLNGFRMDASNVIQWWGYFFDIKEGGELTLRDSEGGGQLTGQNSQRQAAVKNAGLFRMEGGTITSNTGYGVNNLGTFIMTGGAIMYNERGVTVTGTGTMEVSGSPRIISNGSSSAYNVLVNEGQTIRIRQEDGGLAEDALIGIHATTSPMTLTSGATGDDGTVYARPKNFQSDFASSFSLLIGRTEGEIFQTTGVFVEFNANGGSGRQGEMKAAPGGEITLPECGFTPPQGKMFDAWEVEGGRYAPGETAEVGDAPAAKALWKYQGLTFTGTSLTGLTDSYGSVVSVSLRNSISPYDNSAFLNNELVVKWYRTENGERIGEIQGEMDYTYMNATIPGQAVAGDYEFVVVNASESREVLVKPFSVWHTRQYDLVAPGFTLNKIYDGQPIVLNNQVIRVENGEENWEDLVETGLSRVAWEEEYSNRNRSKLESAPEEPGTYYVTIEEKTSDGTWVALRSCWKAVISQADPDHPRYAVTFDLDGAEGTTPETVVLTTGESLTLPECTATKPECVFTGWKCLINGNSSIYAAGSTITPNAKVKATATWAYRSVTLRYGTFHRTGDHSASQVEGTYWQRRNPDKKYTMNYGYSGTVGSSGVTVFDLTAYPANGYVFDGWYEGQEDLYWFPTEKLITRDAHYCFSLGTGEETTMRIVAVFAETAERGDPEVTLPANLRLIDAEAFAGSSVKSVLIPEPPEGETVIIAAGTFKNCASLQWIEIPEGVTVQSGAFEGCSGVICYGEGGAAVAEEYSEQGFLYGGE